VDQSGRFCVTLCATLYTACRTVTYVRAARAAAHELHLWLFAEAASCELSGTAGTPCGCKPHTVALTFVGPPPLVDIFSSFRTPVDIFSSFRLIQHAFCVHFAVFWRISGRYVAKTRKYVHGLGRAAHRLPTLTSLSSVLQSTAPWGAPVAGRSNAGVRRSNPSKRPGLVRGGAVSSAPVAWVALLSRSSHKDGVA
jgi:hypothetical protein